LLVRVGLTGGLGSGKSTVAALLAEHGAVVIDADAIALEVVRAGTSGFDAVVARFGEHVVGADGELDRGRLAEIVFSDDAARYELNEIVHPLVARRSAQLMAAVADDAIVVYDVPLLAENGLAGGFDVVVVVEADLPIRLGRLAARGLPVRSRCSCKICRSQTSSAAEISSTLTKSRCKTSSASARRT